MKKCLVLFLTFYSFNFAWAGLGNEILIQGRIHSFDPEKAKVIDVHDQVYNLPRRFFPKDFVFKTGKMFMIEMKFEDFEKLEIKKTENN